MRRNEARVWLERELSTKHSSDQARYIAQMLLRWALSLSHAEILSHSELPLTKKEEETLIRALEEHLSTNKPLQYILGSVPFLSASIIVRPPVLIPRPETELMCDYIITELQKLNKPTMTLLDMCTGSGCIAISLAQAFPQSTVYATDISSDAIALAHENVQANNCANVTVLTSDLFTTLPPTTFDALISNPPYVSFTQWKTLDTAITQWEDPQAFLAGYDGLTLINKIITEAPHWLCYEKDRQVPQLILECAEYHAHQVVALMEQAGFNALCHKDYAGKDRFVAGILKEKAS